MSHHIRFTLKRLILLLFILSSYGHAENGEDMVLEKLKDRVEYQMAGENLTEARRLVDSVLPLIQERKNKIDFLIISSKIYSLQSEAKKGITHAELGLKLATREGDLRSQARLYGILGSHCRWISLYDRAKGYINKGLLIVERIDDLEFKNRYKANVYHELAEIAVQEMKYNEVLEYLEKSLYYYRLERDVEFSLFGISQILALKGQAYVNMDQGEKGLEFLNDAWEIVIQTGLEDNLFGEFVRQVKGEAFLKLNQLDSAEIYLNKVADWSVDNPENLVTLYNYKAFRDFYKQKGDASNFYLYDKKLSNLAEIFKQKYSIALNQFVISDDFDEVMNESRGNGYFVTSLMLGILVMAGLGALWYFSSRNKKQPERVMSNNKKVEVHEIMVDSEVNAPRTLSFSEKTAQEIKIKIEKFVEDKEFLDQDMTFSKMTGMINTNTKYLNCFLREYFHTDFTSYINDLRIKYIMDRLEKEPEIRAYKLTYLAKMCGYSSYSAFAVNFKRVTEQTPSEYLNAMS